MACPLVLSSLAPVLSVNGPVPTAPKYTADRYIDLTGPQFKGTLKVDFLWSIPDNAH